ncbi:MAG: hypothetical protein A2W91_15775 [Bacteroidetes bacterium GWF2_38_335]|nr:MAG: hypothetical protein A2W91_15775 [Bacteroidetes bacterium GWF2_38_335]HBS85264.1 hypothetical protein [Bacteroidales bacterium]
MAEDNYKYLLDKTIETQKSTSKKLVRNLLLQLASIVLAFGLSNNLLEIQILAMDYLKIRDTQIILILLPVLLLYLFIEFGFLVSLFISCVKTKQILSKKLFEDCDGEVHFDENKIKFVKASMKGTSLFEPMAYDFPKDKTIFPLNFASVSIAFLLMYLNNFFTLYIANDHLCKSDYSLIYGIYIAIAIPFYLSFGYTHKNNKLIWYSMCLAIIALVVSSIIISDSHERLLDYLPDIVIKDPEIHCN